MSVDAVVDGLGRDDDDFVDDGLGQPVVQLEPVGSVTLPSGVSVVPRELAGQEDLASYREYRRHKEHTLTYGPPGTGKSVSFEAAFFPDAVREDPGDEGSAFVHYGMETLVGTADTTEADFVGTWVQDPNNGRFLWVPGPLQRAIQNDIPLYIDEIFLIDPRVLSVVYPLMDGRDVLRITANPTLPPLHVGPGFFVIASGNPNVPGANFSEALRDRFHHHIEINTDWKLARSLGVPKTAVEAAKRLDQHRREGNIMWSPQLRALLAFKTDHARYGLEYAVRGLVGKAPFDDQEVVSQVMMANFGIGDGLRLGGQYG